MATKLAMIGDSREAITSAGSITTRLLGSFQHIDHVIIVGVGGGVPHFTDPAQHTRLGDVVISYRSSGTTEWDSSSTYVYAHSFVVNRKTEQVDGFATHNWQPKSNQLADVLRNGFVTLFMYSLNSNFLLIFYSNRAPPQKNYYKKYFKSFDAAVDKLWRMNGAEMLPN